MEILKFIYKNVLYLLLKENDKYVPCKKINGTLSYELNNKERKMFDSVLGQLVVTENRVKLDNVVFGDKEYQHFYDKNNDWNIFYNADGSKLNENEIKLFNILYNHRSDVMYSDGPVKKEGNAFIKRIVKIGGETIAVLLTTGALFTAKPEINVEAAEYSSNIDVDNDIEQIETLNTNVSIKTNEEKIQMITDAINNNPNINEQEKDVLRKNIDSIKKDIDYIDAEYIANNFATLQIFYNVGGMEYNGTYDITSNVIDLYGPTASLDEKHAITLDHESKHAMQKLKNYAGIYEQVVRDMVKNDQEDAMDAYYQIFTKIVGDDTLKKAFYQADIDSLKDKLISIIDEKTAYQFLNEIDRAYTFKYYYTQGAEYCERMYISSLMRVESYIDDYYKAVKGKSIYKKEISTLAKVHPQVINAQSSKEAKKICDTDFAVRISNTVNREGKELKEIEQEIMPYFDIGYTILKEKQLLNKEQNIKQKVGIVVANDRGYQSLNISIGKDIKLNLDDEYAKDIIVDLGNTFHTLKDLGKSDSIGDAIDVSLNGNILTICNVDHQTVYSIDVTTGRKVSLEQIVFKANCTASEFERMLYTKVTNISSDEYVYSGDITNLGIDDYGNILVSCKLRAPSEQGIYHNYLFTIDPKEAMDYSMHNPARGL